MVRAKAQREGKARRARIWPKAALQIDSAFCCNAEKTKAAVPQTLHLSAFLHFAPLRELVPCSKFERRLLKNQANPPLPAPTDCCVDARTLIQILRIRTLRRAAIRLGPLQRRWHDS
jgi:hypothetical protein